MVNPIRTRATHRQPALLQVTITGNLLARGFWLYVCAITTADGRELHYVGRTGDKPSGESQSPFDRLSKHLGNNRRNNALRRHLEGEKIDLEECAFKFIAFGPLLSNSHLDHGELCDRASALEKALAEDMVSAGYTVLNQVRSRKPLDRELYRGVRAYFQSAFPGLPANRVPQTRCENVPPPCPTRIPVGAGAGAHFAPAPLR